MSNYLIEYNDLSFEKKQDILHAVKMEILQKFKDEAKEKSDLTFKEFMISYPGGYDICWQFDTQEEKDKYFDIELDQFIERHAIEKINASFINLLVQI